MTGPIERRIAGLLRAGMTAAAVVVCLGAAWFLAVHGAEPVGQRTVREPRFDGRALMQLGLVILVVTPIARVAFSVCAFASVRDRAYAAISSVVLCILLYSLFGGR